jgi:hypothetical protein
MMTRMKSVRSTLSGGFTVLLVSGVCLVVLVLMALVILGAYGGLTWLTDHWQPFAAFPVAVDATLFTLVTGLLLYGLLGVRQYQRERHAYQQSLIRAGPMRALIETLPTTTVFLLLERIALLMAVIVTFSGLCRHWYLAYGGFTTSSTDFFSWLGYGVEWLLDNYTLNLTQVFNWNLSDVQATALGARVLVFGFNVVLDVAAVRSIVMLGH